MRTDEILRKLAIVFIVNVNYTHVVFKSGCLHETHNKWCTTHDMFLGITYMMRAVLMETMLTLNTDSGELQIRWKITFSLFLRPVQCVHHVLRAQEQSTLLLKPSTPPAQHTHDRYEYDSTVVFFKCLICTETIYYYYYFALAQHERKLLFSFLSVTPQVKLRPVALDLKCLSQNPCCP